MATVKIHFTTGNPVEFTTDDAELIAGTFNVNPNGTTRINHSDGTSIIVNREQVTYVTLTGMPV